jgi:hypothetical protein
LAPRIWPPAKSGCSRPPAKLHRLQPAVERAQREVAAHYVAHEGAPDGTPRS